MVVNINNSCCSRRNIGHTTDTCVAGVRAEPRRLREGSRQHKEHHDCNRCQLFSVDYSVVCTRVDRVAVLFFYMKLDPAFANKFRSHGTEDMWKQSLICVSLMHGSASFRKAGSGSALEWKARSGSGSASEWKARSRSRCEFASKSKFRNSEAHPEPVETHNVGMEANIWSVKGL